MQKSVFAAALMLSTLALAQPSLTPPSGPVSETGRFGQRIELSQQTTPGGELGVFRIDEPGSYVLTGNVIVPAGVFGIVVASSDVVIDLNGYTMSSANNEIQTNFAISDNAISKSDFRNITIRNGTIHSVLVGIELKNGCLIEDMRVYNTIGGITVNDSTVRRCHVEGENVGIFARRSRISDCRIKATLDEGIRGEFLHISNTQIELVKGSRGIECSGSLVVDTSIFGESETTGNNAGIRDNGSNTFDRVHITAEVGYISVVDSTQSRSVIRDCTFFGDGEAIGGPGILPLIIGDNNFTLPPRMEPDAREPGSR